MQSYKIAFVARACNIQCVSCIRVVQWKHETLLQWEIQLFNEQPNDVHSGGPPPNCGRFSTFYWAAQHFLSWAVFAAPVAWDQT